MKKFFYLALVMILISSGLSLAQDSKPVYLYLFYGETCPHCHAEIKFLDEIAPKYPNLKITKFEVYNNKNNAELMAKMANAYNTKPLGVPMTFIGDEYYSGFNAQIQKNIEATIKKLSVQGCIDPGTFIDYVNPVPEYNNESCNISNQKTVTLPIVGEIDVANIGLPVFTIIIAGLDGLNPCAMWVLTFLLTLLVYAKSRKKIFFIGFIFVFFSGFIYFLFMTAWLNLFLFIGYVNVIKVIIALFAIIMGLINIKELFFFKKGISLTIPDSAKPKLFKKMRHLVHESAMVGMVIGTIVLAITANFIELLCTAGFPAIYTRILTLKHLPSSTYYLYLAFYNIIYVIPLAIIVLIFGITMGGKKMTEQFGKILKIIGGLMMLALGLILLFKPSLLSFA